MAQNIFAREESAEGARAGGKLKKKKKKKLSPNRKIQDESGIESQKILDDDDFNPYAIDDPLDSVQLRSSKPPTAPKRRKKWMIPLFAPHNACLDLIIHIV